MLNRTGRLICGILVTACVLVTGTARAVAQTIVGALGYASATDTV